MVLIDDLVSLLFLGPLAHLRPSIPPRSIVSLMGFVEGIRFSDYLSGVFK